MSYHRKIGRFSVKLSDHGVGDQSYRYCAALEVSDHPTDEDPAVRLDVSIEDMRELRHLLDRAIVNADEDRAQHLVRLRRIA